LAVLDVPERVERLAGWLAAVFTENICSNTSRPIEPIYKLLKVR